MRVFWTEIKYLKSAARLLNRDYVNIGVLDLSKEVFWFSVGQRTAKLQVVKDGDLKKNPAVRLELNQTRAARVRVPDDGIILKVWQSVTL